MPDIEYASRAELNEHENSIAKLETLYQSLEDLPNTINSLDKTLFTMGENMKAMNDKISGLSDTITSIKTAADNRDKRIQDIDNKSKIDWQTAITQNFWKILSACLGAYVVIQLVISQLGG